MLVTLTSEGLQNKNWVSNQTSFCLHRLINLYLLSQTLDIYLEDSFDLNNFLILNKKPTFLTTSNKTLTTLYRRKPNVDTVLIFKDRLPMFHIIGKRGRTVLLTNNLSIAEVLWTKHRLLDVVILLVNGASPIKAQTWFPYAMDNCAGTFKLHPLDNCSYSSSWTTPLFPDKLRKNFNGCNVTYAVCLGEPYISLDENGNLRGQDVTFMRILAESLGFTVHWNLTSMFEFYDHNAGISPALLGAFGMIQNGTADFAFDNIFVTEFHFKLGEGLPSFRESRMVWMLPTARPQRRISGIYSGLPPKIWFLIIIVFIAVIGVTAIASNFQETSWNWIKVVSICLANPVPALPSTNILRLFLVFFLFYSLHIVWFYQSTLLRNLFLQPMDEQLKTFREAVDAGLTPVVRPWYYLYFFNHSDHDVWDRILKPGQHIETYDYNYHLLVEKKSIFIMANLIPDYVTLRRMFPTMAISEMVFVPAKPLYSPQIAAFGRFGSPLTALFHRKTRNLIESGLYMHLMDIMPEFAPIAIKMESSKRPLDLEILQTAFYLLCNLLIICVIVFVLELLTVRKSGKVIKCLRQLDK